MEEIRQEFLEAEAEAIDRIVDNPNPHLTIHQLYGYREINSGDEVVLSDLRRSPNYIEFRFEPYGLGLRQSFVEPTLIILIMTDPGGGYLHWMVTAPLTFNHFQALWREMVPYEAPRSILTRVLVFTLFKRNNSPNLVPNSRKNFSTRRFAEANALGRPLGEAFVKIKYEIEDEDPSDVTVWTYIRREMNKN